MLQDQRTMDKEENLEAELEGRNTKRGVEREERAWGESTYQRAGEWSDKNKVGPNP